MDKMFKNYIKCGGVKCPNCGSHDIAGDFISTNEGEARQDIVCSACSASWTDVYKLHSISDFQK